MSLLTIIQDACGELGIVQPSAVVSSTDTQTLQLLAIADKEGKDLARRFDWQILQKEATFTTTATATQTAISTLATDFGRIVNRSMWNRTESRPIHGPLTPQQWQKRTAAAAQVGVTYYFRIRGDALMFNPAPATGQTIAFEYISKNWCQSSGGTAQSAWAADTDTAIIDEELIRLGVVWRFKQAKGLEYAEDFRSYEEALKDMFGPDAGNDNVDMTGEPDVWGVNLAEGSWDLS